MRRSSDSFIALIIAALAAFASYYAARSIDPVVLDWPTGDVFFSADVPRVFHNMTDRHSNNFRTAVHPLFSLFTYPGVAFLRGVTGCDAVTAARALVALVAGLWSAAMFALLRRVGCRRGDSILFTILASTGAAATFWFAVPECYSFGSLSILAAALLAAEAERRRFSPNWFVAINVVTAAFTVTNVMVGLLISVTHHPLRRAFRIACAAAGIVLLLSVLQMALFTNAKLPLLSLHQEIMLYTRADRIAGSGTVAASFAVHSMVMPATKLVANDKSPAWPKVHTRSGLRSWGTRWGAPAAAMWSVLLLLGLAGLGALRHQRRLRLLLLGTLAGQLALHLVYGDHTFLYALHWMPFLVIVAALSTLTRARPLALALCAALIVAMTLNNATQFRATAAYFDLDAGERAALLSDVEKR